MITAEQANKAKEVVASLDEASKKAFLEKYNSLDASKKEVVLTRLISGEASLNNTQQKESYLSGVKERGLKAQEDIGNRGTLVENISENLTSGKPLKVGVGALQTLGAPLTLLQAGLSNPMLQVQQGNFNPGRLLGESAMGFTGQKLGEYGDVYRTGIPGAGGKIAGAVGGLTLDVAGPIKVIKSVNKALGKISLMSDGALMKSGQDLTKAVETANTSVGESLETAFKEVNDIKVSNSDFVRNIQKMPKVLIDAVKEEVGDLKTLEPTIANLRKIRQVVGKYKPSSFGKEERGLAENIESAKLDTIYGSLKSTISNYISKEKGVAVAEKLLNLEDSAANVYRASNLLNKVSTNPTLLLKTRTGKVAQGLTEATDVSTREALNILKRSGPEARKYVNRVVNALEGFNRTQRNIKIVKHIGSALTYGGGIGAVGGMVASRLLNKGQESTQS